MPLQRIGYYFSAAQFLQVFAILLAPLVFKKFGLIAGVVYIQIAAAFALACLARTTAASMAGLIYIAFSAFQWMSEPGMYSLLMNKMKPEERNSASAVNALVISSGQAIAALLAGAALARFDYPMVIAGVAAIALIAALLFRFLLHDSPPDKSTATPATVNPFTEPVSDVERYTA